MAISAASSGLSRIKIQCRAIARNQRLISLGPLGDHRLIGGDENLETDKKQIARQTPRVRRPSFSPRSDSSALTTAALEGCRFLATRSY